MTALDQSERQIGLHTVGVSMIAFQMPAANVIFVSVLPAGVS